MRRLFGTGLLALVGLTGTAFAADLSVPSLPTTKAPASAPAIHWSGFYVGVNAGGDWYGGKGFAGGSNVRSLLPASNIINVPSTFDRTSAGFTAGGLAGYNYQIGRFVLGGETDFNYMDSRSDSSGSTSILCCEILEPTPPAPTAPLAVVPITTGSGHSLPTAGPPVPPIHLPALVPIYAVETLGHTSKSQLNWFGTARVRFGYVPTQRLLVYGTGGLAYGEVQGNLEWSNVFSGIATSRYWQGSDSDVRVGWTLGAGAEYALTSSISIRAEYLYLDLGKSNVSANYSGLYPQSAPWTQIYYTSSRDNKFNIARAAVAYKF
jgi:outer membrane immunogenic protein